MINLRLIKKHLTSKGKKPPFRINDIHDGILIYHTKPNSKRNPVYALTIKGFSDRERHCKARWPIRWFLQETLPDMINSHIIWPISHRFYDVVWYVRYRTIDKYHVIKPKTLPPGYYSHDEQLLHGAFDVFCNYYETRFQQISWDDEDWCGGQRTLKPSDVAAEKTALYKWWTVTRPSRKEIDPPTPGEYGITDKEADNLHFSVFRKKPKTEYSIAFGEWCEITNKTEMEWIEEDNAMIIRLAIIRGQMI